MQKKKNPRTRFFSYLFVRHLRLTFILVTDRITEHSQNLANASIQVSSRDFSEPTVFNHVELLIDGLETFRRYYEIMMAAQHSISILAWEVNLSFGLIMATQASTPLPAHYEPQNNKWITLEVQRASPFLPSSCDLLCWQF